MSFWEDLRKRLPVCEKASYLMSASAGPLHPDALERSQAFQYQLHQYGDICWEEFLEEEENVRKKVASLLKVSPQEIAFLGSTSLAMNAFAQLLKNKFGSQQKVMTMEDEFPSTTLGWLHHGFEVNYCASEKGMYSVQNFQKSGPADILLSSHVQYGTGFRQNIEDLRQYSQENNQILVLNATQSMGAFSIDGSQVDLMCASIHKWLMAGFGLAVVKISSKYLSDLPWVGWLSQKDPWHLYNDRLNLLNEARALELGCSPLLQIISLGAVLDWIEKVGGVEKISKRILELTQYARNRLLEEGIPLHYCFPDSCGSGILAVSCNRAGEYEKKLAEKQVYISARGNSLRLALHCFNTEEDIEAFIEAFKVTDRTGPL